VRFRRRVLAVAPLLLLQSSFTISQGIFCSRPGRHAPRGLLCSLICLLLAQTNCAIDLDSTEDLPTYLQTQNVAGEVGSAHRHPQRLVVADGQMSDFPHRCTVQSVIALLLEARVMSLSVIRKLSHTL
jgi:hypothetical protein